MVLVYSLFYPLYEVSVFEARCKLREEVNMRSHNKFYSRKRSLLIGAKIAVILYLLILSAGYLTSNTTAYYREYQQMNGSMTIGSWKSGDNLQRQTSDERIDIVDEVIDTHEEETGVKQEASTQPNGTVKENGAESEIQQEENDLMIKEEEGENN
jgi:YqxM protein